MSFTTFSVGRDTQLVVMVPSGRIDLTHVTAFESRQLTQTVRVSRMDGTHMGTELPRGWEGAFELDRGEPFARVLRGLAQRLEMPGADRNGK